MKKKTELIGQIVEQFKNRNTPVRTWISDITTDNLAIVIAKYYSAIVGQVYNQESIAERCSIIAKYLTQTDKIGLALIGPPGTGKSSFLRAISRSLIHFGKPAFCFETSIIKELITNHPEDWDSYCSGRFCLVDDVGVEQYEIKQYGNSITPVRTLIEGRYNKRLPTIFTSNLNIKSLSELYGDRVSDRLREYAIIAFNEQSYRGRVK